MKIRLFALVLLLLGTLGFGKGIEVQSGDFAYFGVSVSAVNVAGESAKMTLNAYDAYGNPTNYFGPAVRTFSIRSSGSATPDKQTFTSADLATGSMTISLSDNVAESVNVAFAEGQSLLLVKNMASGTFVPGFTLKFAHGAVETFELSVPEKLLAGEEFTVTVTAKDRVGNVIDDYSNVAEGVVVTAEGEKGKKSLMVPSDRFTQGRAEVSFRYDYSGKVTMSAVDMNHPNAKGKTGSLAFEQQNLARLEVTSPDSIRAGVPFAVEIKAINQFGRVMKNYSAVGDDVLLSTNGKGQLLPNRVPAKSFMHGVARFETLYTVPEAIVITAAPEKTPLAKPRMAFDAPAKPAAAPAKGVPAAQTGSASKPSAAKPAPIQPAPVKAPAAPQPAAAPSEAPKADQKSAIPLSFRFDPALGEIQRIETEYVPQGDLGMTRIYVRFSDSRKISSVQPITKEIMVNDRVIGTLNVDGKFDRQERLKVEIKELESFSVDVKNGRKSLDLTFLIDN